jgi:hypothetical protein
MAASPEKQWHSANCHCGIIQYRVLIRPLARDPVPHKVMNCNCHMCTRNGYLNVYPVRDEIRVRLPSLPTSAGEHKADTKEGEEVSPGSEELRSIPGILGYYVFDYGPRETEHVFCLHCGSSLWVDANGGKKAFQAMIEDAKAKGDDAKGQEKDIVAINVSHLPLI